MRHLNPVDNPADICTDPEDFLALVRTPSTYLYEEDLNLGDEAFVRVFEDPDY